MYSDDRDDHDDELAMMASELITLTEKLEAGYVSRVGMESLPEFLRHLHAFQAELMKKRQILSVKPAYFFEFPNWLCLLYISQNVSGLGSSIRYRCTRAG